MDTDLDQVNVFSVVGTMKNNQPGEQDGRPATVHGRADAIPADPAGVGSDI
jgi:hypothetical protein